jgi:hypothetical protein
MSVPDGVDTSRPSIARVWDAWLGGKDNFDVDREAAAQVTHGVPMDEIARHIRSWLGRVVTWLADTAHVDQFLDLGSGLPTTENVHQVAQRVNPEAIVVYVDNDPVVAAHGRVLLEENDNTHFAALDLTDPDELLSDPAVASHLDFARPIAVIQCSTLHFIPVQADAERIMRGYIDRLSSGSYVAVMHTLAAGPGEDEFAASVAAYQNSTAAFTPRTLEQIRALFSGLELVQPGLVPVTDWWPTGPHVAPLPRHVQHSIGGLGRKP